MMDMDYSSHPRQPMTPPFGFLSIGVSLIAIASCCSPPLWAQKPRKDVAAIFKSWDKNADGMLQESEIPSAARAKVLGAAKQQGIDPSRPINIETYFARQKQGNAAKKATPRSDLANMKAGGKKADTKLDAAETKVKRSSKSFGTRKPATPRAAFGKGNKKAEKPEESDSEQAKLLRRLKPLAKSMMAQHDKNKNGRLEKSEWKRLRGEPAKSDRNKDGELSMAELTEHLAGYGRRENSPRPNNERKRTKRRSLGNSSSDKKSYRFRTPHERLPPGLPIWFIENDVNGDGQLSLKEYASPVNSAKLAKFEQLDLNHDGLLVAKEYLKATE